MVAPSPRRSVDPPRLGASLHDVADLDLSSDTAIEAMSVAGGTVVGGEVVDVDVVGSRLRGVELTGATVERLRLMDVVIQECELSGAHLQLSKARLAGTALHGSTLEGVLGGEALRGASIGSDQIVALALPVFAALGITVDDEPQA